MGEDPLFLVTWWAGGPGRGERGPFPAALAEAARRELERGGAARDVRVETWSAPTSEFRS